MAEHTRKCPKYGTWVIKIGSALLTQEGAGLRHTSLDAWVEQMMQLRAAGVDLVVVSSGAVAEGAHRLSWPRHPLPIHILQAAAAVGQMGLVQAWESRFRKHAVNTAQILLTYDDVADRRRYLNARTTLRTIMKLGVVPVVNENDTVATDEICLGDNDALAAMVANLVEADILVILTDQAGLHEADPLHHPDAALITEGRAGDSALDRHAGTGGTWGRGGMRTKLAAARIAARSGTDTFIACGREVDVLLRLARGEDLGTWLRADCDPLVARKQWLAAQSRTCGTLLLDSGALHAVTHEGKSVLAAGVLAAEGDFQSGEIVACKGAEGGHEMVRGLVNYAVAEVRQIMGKQSSEIAPILGYHATAALIHRDNLVVL